MGVQIPHTKVEILRWNGDPLQGMGIVCRGCAKTAEQVSAAIIIGLYTSLTWTSYILFSSKRCARDLKKVKVKASHTRYRALGPKLIPVYRQSACMQVTVSHPPSDRLPLLSARPAVTSPAAEHHRPLSGAKLYCLVTEAHRCKQLA